MMESEIRQLVDMVLHLTDHLQQFSTNMLLPQGATVAQARAALKRCSDVMEAAERIFDGAFDDIPDDAAATLMPSAGHIRERRATARLVVCVLPRALSSGSYMVIDSRG
jgi:hypothetical protein